MTENAVEISERRSFMSCILSMWYEKEVTVEEFGVFYEQICLAERG